MFIELVISRVFLGLESEVAYKQKPSDFLLLFSSVLRKYSITTVWSIRNEVEEKYGKALAS